MLDLQNLYLKFSNISLRSGLKSAHNALSTPPSPFLGKINTSNLAPLNADTVSFTGRGKANKLNKCDSNRPFMGDGAYPSENLRLVSDDDIKTYEIIRSAFGRTIIDNADKAMNHQAYSAYRSLLPLASDVYKQAKRAQGGFEITMCIFDSLVEGNSKSNKKYKPIAEKTTRVKSPQSIAKKMAVKVAELENKNDGYHVPVNQAFIKAELHDLLGARLILANGTRSEMNSVVNRLVESIESGHGPRIKTIKNYGAGHKYLSPSKSDELEAVNYKAYGHYPEVVNKKKTSGYTATHIIIEAGNGIDAEIQILGRGVARVKEIDDICYKGLQGKAISGMSDVSKALKAISRDPDLKKEFDKYITSAYEIARTQWDKMPDEELKKQKFPSIDTKKFPACLDLNNIEAELKEQALRKKHKGY